MAAVVDDRSRFWRLFLAEGTLRIKKKRAFDGGGEEVARFFSFVANFAFKLEGLALVASLKRSDLFWRGSVHDREKWSRRRRQPDETLLSKCGAKWDENYILSHFFSKKRFYGW